MCSGSDAGSYARLIDSCITQLKAQGPCNESKEEEKKEEPVVGCALYQGAGFTSPRAADPVPSWAIPPCIQDTR